MGHKYLTITGPTCPCDRAAAFALKSREEAPHLKHQLGSGARVEVGVKLAHLWLGSVESILSSLNCACAAAEASGRSSPLSSTEALRSKHRPRGFDVGAQCPAGGGGGRGGDAIHPHGPCVKVSGESRPDSGERCNHPRRLGFAIFPRLTQRAGSLRVRQPSHQVGEGKLGTGREVWASKGGARNAP